MRGPSKHRPYILVLLVLESIDFLSSKCSSSFVLTTRLSQRCCDSILHMEESSSSSKDKKRFQMPSTNKLISDLLPSERGIGVGIDLGTTNSCISVLNEKGIPIIVPVDGRNTMPSIVSLIPPSNSDPLTNIKSLVGWDALLLRGHHEYEGSKTYFHIKRVMGMGITTAACSADVVPHLVFKDTSQRQRGLALHERSKKGGMETIRWEDGMKDARDRPVRLTLPQGHLEILDERNDDDDTHTILPEELSSMILQKLIHSVESMSSRGEKVTRAVVGIPAYFNEVQKEATIKAITLGSNIPRERIRLIREPEAAAMAYGIGKRQIGKDSEDEIVLVFDLGGGTFDVSILEVGNGVMEIIATSGNNMLGGSDFDAKIAQFISKKLVDHGVQKNYWKEGSSVAMAMVASAEQIRITLSNTRDVLLALPMTETDWLNMARPSNVLVPRNQVTLSSNETSFCNGTHVICTLTRKEMEKLCSAELDALMRPLREVAILAGVMLPGDASPAAVNAVLQLEEEKEEEAIREEEMFQLLSSENLIMVDQQDDVGLDDTVLLQLHSLTLKDQKKSQQRGRKRAREVQKDEKKFREEKRKVEDVLRKKVSNASDIKVRDGINGRRITQVVLVGGATRMPVIGKLLSVVTGVPIQRTVNPDEAIALGCAVQVGILDGTWKKIVLSPIEAAMMRALAKKRGMDTQNNNMFGSESESYRQ